MHSLTAAGRRLGNVQISWKGFALLKFSFEALHNVENKFKSLPAGFFFTMFLQHISTVSVLSLFSQGSSLFFQVNYFGWKTLRTYTIALSCFHLFPQSRVCSTHYSDLPTHLLILWIMLTRWPTALIWNSKTDGLNKTLDPGARGICTWPIVCSPVKYSPMYYINCVICYSQTSCEAKLCLCIRNRFQTIEQTVDTRQRYFTTGFIIQNNILLIKTWLWFSLHDQVLNKSL